MRNIKLIIEYDGTNYSGWQIQPNGLAIQQVLEEALAKLVCSPVRLHSSGRTDAGVHAKAMVACFRTDKQIPLTAFSDGLNALIPCDIAINDAVEVPLEFHPRFDAIGKHYRYTIYNAQRRSPLARLQAWHLRGGLSLSLMRKAAADFVGEHDFAAFRSSGCASTTTVRRIDTVEIGSDGDIINIDVHGSGFLRNMVRVMVGTLAAVGQAKLAPDIIQQLLSAPDRNGAGITAPAHGLCLMEVFYAKGE